MSSSVVNAKEGGPSSAAVTGDCFVCGLTLVRTRLALTPAVLDAPAAAGRSDTRFPDPGTFGTREVPGICSRKNPLEEGSPDRIKYI